MRKLVEFEQLYSIDRLRCSFTAQYTALLPGTFASSGIGRISYVRIIRPSNRRNCRENLHLDYYLENTLRLPALERMDRADEMLCEREQVHERFELRETGKASPSVPEDGLASSPAKSAEASFATFADNQRRLSHTNQSRR